MLSYNLGVEAVIPSNCAEHVKQEPKLAYSTCLFLRNIINTGSKAESLTAGGTEDESGTR